MIASVTPESAAIYAPVYAALVIALILDARQLPTPRQKGWRKIVADIAAAAKGMAMVLVLVATFACLAVAGMSDEEIANVDEPELLVLVVNLAFWIFIVSFAARAANRITAKPAPPQQEYVTELAHRSTLSDSVVGVLALVGLTTLLVRPRRGTKRSR